MEEKLIKFSNLEGEKLFGIFTFPKKRKKFPAIILVHGFSKTKSERKFVELARELAKNGIASLRFDFSGCGDSEGKFEKMTITKEVEELTAAYLRLIKEKRVDKKRIGIFAHSLGTVISSLFYSWSYLFWDKPHAIKCLIFAAPALNQKKLIKRWYNKDQIKQWRKQKYLDTAKFRIGIGYLKDAINFTKILTLIEIPTLILHGKKDEDIPLEMAKKSFKKLETKEKKMIIIADADHSFEKYSSRQKLINYSINFLKKYL